MAAKERSSAINLSVSKELKEEFSNLAYAIWTTPAGLLKILMKQVILTRQINLRFDPFENVEIEPLDISNFSDNFKIKTEEYTQELKTLLAKNRKQWK